MWSLWKIEILLDTRNKTKKKIHRVLEFNQSQWLKPYVEFNTKKKIEKEKIMTKTEKLCNN